MFPCFVLLYLQHLEQHLARSRSSVKVCRMNERTTVIGHLNRWAEPRGASHGVRRFHRLVYRKFTPGNVPGVTSVEGSGRWQKQAEREEGVQVRLIPGSSQAGEFFYHCPHCRV